MKGFHSVPNGMNPKELLISMVEGWFPTLHDVPKEAITLTIPTIMTCKRISCVVPDERKAQAVYDTLHGSITTRCPASILRRHLAAVVYLDHTSAHQISDKPI